jgi:hypothetical protein
MDFSTARALMRQGTDSEFAASCAVETAFVTGLPQTLSGRTVRYVPGQRFQVGKPSR